jgi:DNA polymerase theta
VAELLLIRHTVNLKKKCIVVLPFVSIVTEKTKHFRKILADEKVEIGCFRGGARAPDLWDIAVCTIEKVPPERGYLTEGKLAD